VSTAVAETMPRTAVVPGPRLRSVLALTLIEGRRLITHPAILVGSLILLLGLVALARRPRSPGIQLYGATAVVLTAVGGVMQVLAASP